MNASSRGASVAPPGGLVTCSAAETVNYRASTRAPGWAPGWGLRGGSRRKVNDHGDESTFVSRSPTLQERRHAASPLGPAEQKPGFPGWASPGGSHHFFATLPPARSQLVTDSAEVMRPLQGFMQRPKVVQLETRQPILSPARGGDGFGRPSRRSSTAMGGPRGGEGRVRQVKAGVLGMAMVPDFEQRVGARPNPHAHSTANGLNWGNCWCEVDEGGKMRLCASSGSAVRVVDLRRTYLDVVKGSIHAVLEEDTSENPVLPEKYKNEAFLLPRDGPRLNLPPTSQRSVAKSPVFLKFANDIEMGAWIDTLLDQGVVPGPGVQGRAQRRTRVLPPPVVSKHAGAHRAEGSGTRSKSVEAVDPTAFEASLPPNLKGAERARVMYDYQGTAPISRRTLSILPLEAEEREILESPLPSAVRARSQSKERDGAWRRSGVSAASLTIPSPQRMFAADSSDPRDAKDSVGQDLIRMHARAVEVRKGQNFVSTPTFFLLPGDGCFRTNADHSDLPCTL